MMDTIDLERLDKRKAYPYPGNRHGRGPGKRRALPLTGAALARWQRWAAGVEEDREVRRAVV